MKLHSKIQIAQVYIKPIDIPLNEQALTFYLRVIHSYVTTNQYQNTKKESQIATAIRKR